MKIEHSVIGECDICGEEGELLTGVCSKPSCKEKAGATKQYLPKKIAIAIRKRVRKWKS